MKIKNWFMKWLLPSVVEADEVFWDLYEAEERSRKAYGEILREVAIIQRALRDYQQKQDALSIHELAYNASRAREILEALEHVQNAKRAKIREFISRRGYRPRP